MTMGRIKNNQKNNSKRPTAVSAVQPRSNKIRITLVSELERDIYRVPSYGYLLP